MYELDNLHIDDFNKDAARTLVFLYNYFPRKMDLYVEDISGPDEVDDYGLHSDRYLACMSAIIWLAEEGLIRYDALVKQESFDQAVLSKQSYVLLNHLVQREDDETTNGELPESIRRARRSRIAAFKQALQNGSSEQLSQVMTRFIFDSEKAQGRIVDDLP